MNETHYSDKSYDPATPQSQGSDVHKHGIFKCIPSSLHTPSSVTRIEWLKFEALKLKFVAKGQNCPSSPPHHSTLKMTKKDPSLHSSRCYVNKCSANPPKCPHLMWRSIRRQGLHTRNNPFKTLIKCRKTLDEKEAGLSSKHETEMQKVCLAYEDDTLG